MDKPTKIIIAGAAVQILLTVAFVLFFLFWDTGILPGAIGFAVLSLCNFLVGYLFLYREVNGTLRKVDDTIEQLVNGTPAEYFDAREETLLGKFQSQITRLYRILLAHKDQEKRQREDLSALVADLVHQINTPLANIEMYVDFLLSEDLDEETRKKFLSHVKSQTERLGWFGEGFDKAARLETDIISMKPVRLEVLPAVLEAIDEVSLKAQKKNCEICLEGDRSITAFYDRKWTTEAFFNILDNAVKYGDEGEKIHVRLSAYQLYVRVDVENVGPVIPPGERAEVFRRFYRGETAALVQEGVGLGLHLVREIVAGEGGYVLVENWENKGNRFSIFLRNAGEDEEGGEP